MADLPVDEAVHRVLERVAAAAERAGRAPREVRVVAAVKNVDAGRIRQAVEAGITELGENRAKDLEAKANALRDLAGPIRWHYLGAVQTNKIRYLDPVECVQTVDRLREVVALQSRAEQLDRSWEVLIEVNIAGEAQKQGIPPHQIHELLEGMGSYPRVRPRGLMLMAPQVENAEDVRGVFAQARRLHDRFAPLGLGELSMGMSDDFEVAIEEGATIVRIGRAFFSPESA
jgi:PLP dependent protein